MNVRRPIRRIDDFRSILLNMATYSFLIIFLLECTQDQTMDKDYLIKLTGYFTAAMDKELVEAIIKHDDKGVQKTLDSGANPNADGDFGKSPIAIAIMTQNIKALEVLIKNGANPNHRHQNGATAAIEAIKCEDGNYLAVLLKAGLNPSIQNGETPLIFSAIAEARRDYYQTLVEKGADLNAKTSSGRTVTSLLIAVGWYEEVKELITRGGDFHSGYGPKHITPAQELIYLQHRFGGEPEGKPFRNRAEILRTLRDRGVTIPDNVPGV